MKTFKNIMYGLCVFWLLFLVVDYGLIIAFDGLSSINDHSLDDGLLFITMICVAVVIIKYPIKQWATNAIKQIKKDFKDRQKNKAKGIKSQSWTKA